MSILPAGATASSERLCEVARRLAQSCPAALSREIALTGSVARGIADNHSDIELNLWTDGSPGLAMQEWLRDIGTSDLSELIYDESTESQWVTCRYQQTWIEVGVADMDRQAQLLTHIMNGKVADHERLILASSLEHAIVLATDGWLTEWRTRLDHYPVELAATIVRNNTRAWSDPHTPMVRWALAERSERMALAMRFTWDMQNLLRVLFAINHVWEPDWKWLEASVRDLAVKPDGLAERIGRIFVLDKLDDCVRHALQLIQETLALVPKEYDVSLARLSIAAALKAGPDS